MRIMPALRSVLLFPLCLVLGVHDSLNLVLPRGQQACFYEELPKNANPRELEIFIPQNGNTDIVLQAYGPLSLSEVQQGIFTKLIFTETVNAADQVETDSQSFVKEFSPGIEGIYAFCVDNSRSHILAKKVEFNIKIISSDDDGLQTVKAGKMPWNDNEEVDERLKEAVAAIRDGLDMIQEQQRVDRNRLSLHSARNYNSHTGVVVDSIVETIIFIFSLLFQVFFVRKWYLTKSDNNNEKYSF